MKTANVAGRETTGNASKAGYDAEVAVRPFTMYLAGGEMTEEELAAAKSAITKLGGKVDAVKTVYLKSESEQDERLLIKITKITKTPKPFPRAYAKIVKSPL